MNFGFKKNHVPFIVCVLFVFLHMDCHTLCFLHEIVQVFGHGRCEVLGFEDGGNAFTRDWLDKRYSVLVAQDGTYAASIVAFLCELNDEGFDFLGFVFTPAWRASANWADTVRFSFFLFGHLYTLILQLKTTKNVYLRITVPRACSIVTSAPRLPSNNKLYVLNVLMMVLTFEPRTTLQT